MMDFSWAVQDFLDKRPGLSQPQMNTSFYSFSLCVAQLRVLKERPWWPTCWLIGVIETHTLIRMVCARETFGEHFQKCAWITLFVCNPCFLQNIKTSKYTCTRTKQTMNAENRSAGYVWVRKQTWFLPAFWGKFVSLFEYETHCMAKRRQWQWLQMG